MVSRVSVMVSFSVSCAV